jgi:ABC-type bacteriocin/lantibiotic exporter with double-glycine peptidase domain
MFLAASSRLAPALIRIQQGFVALRGNLAQSQGARDFLRTNSGLVNVVDQNTTVRFSNSHPEFEPGLEVQQVSFAFPGSSQLVLDQISFEAKFGEVLAIQGESGSGKSTLLDLLLGLNSPSKGTVKIAGLDPKAAIQKYSGAVGYLPQNVWLTSGDVSSNILLGFDPVQIDSQVVTESIRAAQLSSMFSSEVAALSHEILDGGKNLSGGQKQRVGLARTLVTAPKIMFFDEPTSALDKATERQFLDFLGTLKGKVTLVIVTHSQAVSDFADRTYLLKDGRLELRPSK